MCKGGEKKELEVGQEGNAVTALLSRDKLCQLHVRRLKFTCRQKRVNNWTALHIVCFIWSYRDQGNVSAATYEPVVNLSTEPSKTEL